MEGGKRLMSMQIPLSRGLDDEIMTMLESKMQDSVEDDPFSLKMRKKYKICPFYQKVKNCNLKILYVTGKKKQGM